MPIKTRRRAEQPFEDDDRRRPWFRLSPEIAIVLVTAIVQAVIYWAMRNAEIDKVKESVDRVDKSVISIKDGVDKSLPALKDEVKQYVKERDELRSKDIARLEEEVRRRALETSDTLKEQARILQKLELAVPQRSSR